MREKMKERKVDGKYCNGAHQSCFCFFKIERKRIRQNFDV